MGYPLLLTSVNAINISFIVVASHCLDIFLDNTKEETINIGCSDVSQENTNVVVVKKKIRYRSKSQWNLKDKLPSRHLLKKALL